jgi:hypothetical protein
MYSLIMTGEDEAWERGVYTLERSRVGEYTDDALRARYRTLDDRTIADLKSIPALFAYEKANRGRARLGRITKITIRGQTVRFEFELLEAVPGIHPDTLLDLALDLDIDDWEMNRTHWAIKDIDLIKVLDRAGVVRAGSLRAEFERTSTVLRPFPFPSDLIVRPKVFALPTVAQERDLASIMMPLSHAFDGVHDAVKAACKEAGLRCLRADDIWEESILIQDIVNLIYRSSVVVVDFSQRNPNVMYETGIAHTLGRPVVPISQSLEDLPFDLQHHRTLDYAPSIDGLEAMRGKLARRLQNVISRTDRSS